MVHRHKKNSASDPPFPEVELLCVNEPYPLILVGAGTVLSDLIALLKEIGGYRIIGVIDPNPGLRGQFVGRIPILGWLADIPQHVTHAVIGTPSTPKAFDREAVFRLLARRNIALPILVSSSSQCAPDLTLRRGDILLGGCSIEAGARLGENCLVGANAVIERCASVPDHQVVAPGRHVSCNGLQEFESNQPRTLGATLASENDSIQDILQHINRANMEIVLVVNAKGVLIGTITDGDIRRGILAGIHLDQPVSLIMNRNPAAVPLGTAHAEMLQLMRRRSIRHLPVVDNERRPIRLERLENLVDSLTGQEAVVMAGGLGSRLGSLTQDTPKPLLPVAGRPILDRILEGLRTSGIEDVVLSLNYLGDRIREHVGNGERHRLHVAYLAEKQRLGTGGALSLLRPRPRKPFVVMNGDLLTNMNFARLLDFQKQFDHMLVMCVRRHRTQVPYGVVDIRDGCVTALREKPVIEHFINAGIYVLKPSCIDLIPREMFFDMTDLVGAIVANGGGVGAFPIYEYWRDIGNPNDLATAGLERKFLDGAPEEPEVAASVPVEALR
jgi:dTDP-glucose pyrophosphorylase